MALSPAPSLMYTMCIKYIDNISTDLYWEGRIQDSCPTSEFVNTGPYLSAWFLPRHSQWVERVQFCNTLFPLVPRTGSRASSRAVMANSVTLIPGRITPAIAESTISILASHLFPSNTNSRSLPLQYLLDYQLKERNSMFPGKQERRNSLTCLFTQVKCRY